jgi:signal peptidase II
MLRDHDIDFAKRPYRMTIAQRLVPLIVVGTLITVSDQYTKWLARTYLELDVVHSYLGDLFRIQLAHNYGAFLSLGASLPPIWREIIWTYGVGCILIWLLYYTLTSKSVTRGMTWLFVLIIAGGLNNLYDRIVYGGYVIDFLNLGVGPVRTGVFNIADLAIMAGAIGAMIASFRESHSGEEPKSGKNAVS